MTAAIEIKDFSYSYHDGVVALKNINLRIEHGERVALIGPNGAGKSTLLLAMSNFIRGSGKVLIDGLETTSGNGKAIRSIVGSVLQNPDEQLFMPTLFDDVAFGPLNMGLSAEEVKARTENSLGLVGLAGMSHRAPHHLSAGQKRSAAIATILSMSPRIITMDEPDNSLDPRNCRNLLRILSSLNETLIIATCNMGLAAKLCRRAVLLDNGVVIADDEAAKVMSDSALMLSHGLEVPAEFLR